MEKSTDGVTWSAPVAALGNGATNIYFPWLAVDQNAGSPYSNSVYTFGVNLAGSPQVLVSRSRDGGDTWAVAQVAADPPNVLTAE